MKLGSVETGFSQSCVQSKLGSVEAGFSRSQVQSKTGFSRRLGSVVSTPVTRNVFTVRHLRRQYVKVQHSFLVIVRTGPSISYRKELDKYMYVVFKETLVGCEKLVTMAHVVLINCA